MEDHHHRDRTILQGMNMPSTESNPTTTTAPALPVTVVDGTLFNNNPSLAATTAEDADAVNGDDDEEDDNNERTSLLAGKTKRLVSGYIHADVTSYGIFCIPCSGSLLSLACIYSHSLASMWLAKLTSSTDIGHAIPYRMLMSMWDTYRGHMY